MQTLQEVRDEYVRLMGDDLGLSFHELTLEEEWLSDKWAVYQELFEKGQERIDILNRTAAIQAVRARAKEMGLTESDVPRLIPESREEAVAHSR